MPVLNLDAGISLIGCHLFPDIFPGDIHCAHGQAAFDLVSPSIEKRGVEFHDLSVSLSVQYDLAVTRAGGIPVTAPTTTSRALLAEAVRRVDGVCSPAATTSIPALRQKSAARRPGHRRPDARRRRARLARAGSARRSVPPAPAAAGHLPRASVAEHRARRPVDRRHPPPGARRVEPSAPGPRGRIGARSAIDTRFIACQNHRQAGTGREQLAPSGRFGAGAAAQGGGADQRWNCGSNGVAAVTARRMPFLLSVQFHPERLAERHAEHRAIFCAFTQACAPGRDKKL